MELKKGNIYSGFKLLEEKLIKEINSIGRLFEHEKSGARLFYISNEDENKVFSITFRTPPEDSTGLPHILEHSVLCGSKKYPAKEPFVELVKGSLNTFLNAMTFPDKTMYPVASMNNKDFINLMDVYLDAVFYPRIYDSKAIFLQEGWHYHIENENDDLTYNGVVYNEMKGAFSNPEEVVYRKIQESLFPDTQYGKESGGDPDVIPELSYEQFINFHKKYYHPSNSYIYLYGNGDVIKHLEYLDKEYLSAFEKIDIDSTIQIQKAFKEPKEDMYYYPISENEKLDDKTYLSMNFVMDKSTNPELHLAFYILTHILLNSPSAPLKKALMDAEIGKDVVGHYDGSILQPVINIVIKNSNEKDKNKFEKIIFETLSNLCKNGIDKKQIQGAININEFRLREADHGSYPKGIIYGIDIMESWLYDEDPCVHLEFDKTLNKIKKSLESNYFEKLIEKYLINNNHRSMVIVKPQRGMVDKKEVEIVNKLNELKASLNKKDITDMVKETNDLIELQVTPDKEEDVEKIPLLPLEDIKKKSDELELDITSCNEIQVLYHPDFTSGISYIDLLFDLKSIPTELIPYASLLTKYLGQVSTQIYDYSELINETEIHTGGINYQIEVFGNTKKVGEYDPRLLIKSKALSNKIPDLFNLLREIVCFTKYEEKQRLKEIIQSIKANIEMNFMSSGHQVVANRVMSYYSNTAKFLENIKGIDFYNFIRDIESDFDNKYEDVFNKLRKTSEMIFNKNNLIINLTSERDNYEIFSSSLNILTESLMDKEVKTYNYDFNLDKLNEGLMTSSKVQYVGMAYNMKLLGFEYNGAFQVLKTIMSMDYLWNKVRVLGGAYGAFFNINKSGTIFMGSYRDPNLGNTIDVFKNAYKHIEEFDVSHREMSKYIIGTVSNLDIPLSPSMKGRTAASNYLTNITYEDIQKEREQILKCNIEDIKDMAKVIKKCMNKDYLCVLGNNTKIKSEESKFNKLVNLFE